MEDKVKGRRIVVGVTGSIAAFKACDLVSRLRREGGAEVRVVMTEAAERFVGPLSFQTLSGYRVFRDPFELVRDWNPLHIAIADWAECVAVVPATAKILGRTSSGIAEGLLEAVILATRAPVIFAPAMNSKMWTHPAVEGNVERLRSMGYRFVGPVEGVLACGYEGQGRLAPVDDILEAIRSLLP